MPIVTVHPSGEVIYLDPDETVLSGLYRAGYAYAVGCRRGGCAVCKVDCRSGEFHYDHPVAETVLTADERAEGTCLTCRAVLQNGAVSQERTSASAAPARVAPRLSLIFYLAAALLTALATFGVFNPGGYVVVSMMLTR